MIRAVSSSDTIFALATASGRAGVAIVRLSGTDSWKAVEALTDRALGPLRQLFLRRLSWKGEALDEALVAVFQEQASYTGERMAELHLHGGVATVRSVLNALDEVSGLRMAEPGEFTRRALINERLDLVQAEALADLIDAETEAQREQALALMGGGGQEQAEIWRAHLVRALALLEASIDFADEEDAPEDVNEELLSLLRSLDSDLRDAIAASKAGERIRDGYRVALIGAPNAGKSTLLNAVVGRQAAITSPIAGTTRDVIEVSCDFNGVPVVLQDMAGLRETEEEIEKIGLARARERIDQADLRVLLRAPDAPDPVEVGASGADVVVWNKSDISVGEGDLCISAKSGEGVSDFVELVVRVLSKREVVGAVFPRVRQIKHLEASLDEIGLAMESSVDELKSEHLRRAVHSLEALVGRVDVEHLLDEIFASFCLGK
ncbi:MAG: tRNA uridine-5-carboxymethylaminomethyl(34) synthesis GTPase MnmE [Pseudomonadota bacterium]